MTAPPGAGDGILRLALIGVDSSHSVAFTDLLGDGRTGTVRGARVVSAWKGPTAIDLPPSRDRNDALAREVAARGVPLHGSPEEAAAVADALLVLAADPRIHRELVVRLAPLGKPLYVLSRFALSPVEAEAMLEAGRRGGSLVLAGSPKRFHRAVQEALHRPGATPVRSVDLEGPLPRQECLPPMAWYGVHLIDLAVAALGPDWTGVRGEGDALRLTWAGGRSARIHGPRTWNDRTHLRIVREDGSDEEITVIAGPGLHAGLLEELIACCRSGRPSVPAAEILTGVRILAATTPLLAGT